MFISKEEHDRHWVVQLVHLVEVGDLVDIAEVDDGEVFDAVGNAYKQITLVLGSFSIC